MKKLNVKTVVFAGVLIAMNIILTRVFGIDLGPSLRISFGAVPIFLSGLWMGPVVGGLCGGVADVIGCIMKGYAFNPFITMTTMLAGIIPGVMKKYVFKGKLRAWHIAIMVVMQGLLGSMGFTTLGFHIFYGTPYAVLLPSRAIQTVGLVTANTILVSVLYLSPLTKMVQQSLVDRRNPKAKQ